MGYKYIEPFYFVLALIVGLLYVYYYTPEPVIIIKYPTPFNLDTIYKDNANTCYRYDIKKSECPLNKDLIKTFKPL